MICDTSRGPCSKLLHEIAREAGTVVGESQKTLDKQEKKAKKIIRGSSIPESGQFPLMGSCAFCEDDVKAREVGLDVGMSRCTGCKITRCVSSSFLREVGGLYSWSCYSCQVLQVSSNNAHCFLCVSSLKLITVRVQQQRMSDAGLATAQGSLQNSKGREVGLDMSDLVSLLLHLIVHSH